MPKEKILITGSNGFIGGFLVDEALRSGLDVYAAVRKHSNQETLKEQNVSILEIDYDNKDELSETLKQYNFDYIIHNAGITKSPDLQQFMLVNKGLLVKLTDSIIESGIKLKKFVYMSSLAAYGPADNVPDEIIREQSPPKPVTRYGVSKLAAEQYLISQNNLPYVIIRPTAVYGPKDKDFLSVFQMIKYGFNLQPGIGSQRLTFIYVKDLASLILNATLSHHVKKTFFAADGKVYTADVFTKLIEKNLNKKTIKIKVPISIVRTLAFFTENTGKIWGKYAILNSDKVNELEARVWNCDVSNLNHELGFTAKYDLQAGIDETISWYKANNWL